MNTYIAWLAIALLAACSARDGDVAKTAPADPSRSDTAAQIYGGNCVACHQQDARGLSGVYPSLVGSPVVLGDPGDLTRWVIQGRRPASMPPGRYPTKMPRFGWMKPPEAAALFTYLRSHFGNSASSVDAATAARALAQ